MSHQFGQVNAADTDGLHVVVSEDRVDIEKGGSPQPPAWNPDQNSVLETGCELWPRSIPQLCSVLQTCQHKELVNVTMMQRYKDPRH